MDFTLHKAVLLTIPAGAVIAVTEAPCSNDSMVSITWAEKILKVFTVDIEERGEQVRERAAGA